jgi:hypothetical protein
MTRPNVWYDGGDRTWCDSSMDGERFSLVVVWGNYGNGNGFNHRRPSCHALGHANEDCHDLLSTSAMRPRILQLPYCNVYSEPASVL